MTARPVTLVRFLRVLGVGALAAALLVAASALIGAADIDVLGVLAGDGSEVERAILYDIRLPRVLVAALTGGALAICGAAFQALLRNPLAEPYLLGVSGGGSFGAVLAIVALGQSAAAPVWARGAAAFVGCLVALGLVYLIASRGGALQPATLILAGVVTNSFFLAGLACVQYAASPEESQSILRWVMGGLAGQGSAELVLLVVAVPVGGAYLLARAGALNLLVFGEETARSMGLDVDGTRRGVFLAASLVTAASVAVAGPIAFVGLFVPHAVRFLVGGDHFVLLPASFFAGAGFLAVADAAARTALAPREIPVGIVTAIIGAPAFVLLLARYRSRLGGGSA